MTTIEWHVICQTNTRWQRHTDTSDYWMSHTHTHTYTHTHTHIHTNIYIYSKKHLLTQTIYRWDMSSCIMNTWSCVYVPRLYQYLMVDQIYENAIVIILHLLLLQLLLLQLLQLLLPVPCYRCCCCCWYCSICCYNCCCSNPWWCFC